MNVGELKQQLEQYPDDVWLDAMFNDGNDAYPVVGTELLELSDGRKIVIVDIQAAPPLRTA